MIQRHETYDDAVAQTYFETAKTSFYTLAVDNRNFEKDKAKKATCLSFGHTDKITNGWTESQSQLGRTKLLVCICHHCLMSNIPSV